MRNLSKVSVQVFADLLGSARPKLSQSLVQHGEARHIDEEDGALEDALHWGGEWGRIALESTTNDLRYVCNSCVHFKLQGKKI